MNAKLLVLASGNFAVGVSTFVIAPMLGQIGADLDVSRTAAAQLVVVYALAYALGGPVLTALAGHRPPRQLLFVALAVFGAGNGLTAVAANFPGAVAARVLAGVGAGVYTANALAVARRLAPGDRQGRAVAVVVGGLTTAIVLGLPLGAWLGGETSWRLVLGLLSPVAVLPMAAVRLLPALGGSPAVRLAQRIAPLRDRQVLATLLATWLCLTASWTVYNFIDEVLLEATGGDPDRQFPALLVFGAGAVAGNLLAGRLADRFGPDRTIAVVAPVLVVAVLVVPLAAVGMLPALLSVGAWAMLHWMVNVPQQMRVVAAAPEAAPAVLALHQSTIYLGIGTGGFVGSLGYGLAGRSGIGYAAFVTGLAALTALWWSFRTRHPSVPLRPPTPVNTQAPRRKKVRRP
ncbi:MFS transporter [Streptomyces sp. NBC_01808]|uniref:MFS transporter n=1 Tax=Streptomyces sp. NBC_01808 TaxID=2975947 RepID=UPI002DDA4FA4|nr:MFS transporter [Streptomyces sp. NBC_01808]WSA36306.1 MFS transporter [Streptomyces sp. NBC_01808]